MKSDVVKIEMLTMELEDYQRERNELVRQVQLCVESMCSADLQSFSTKRILSEAAINSGMIFPTMGNPLTSLNNKPANGHSEMPASQTQAQNPAIPLYTVKDGQMVRVQ